MRELIRRAAKAVKRRPVRVAEAVIVAFAAAAATWGVDVVDQIETLIAVLAAVGVISGEVAQKLTTPLSDPRLRDGHEHEGAE